MTATEPVRSGDTYDAIETWSPAQLADWQLERVRHVVAGAAGNGFYAGHWREADVDPRRLQSWEDFRRLPLTSKQTLVAAGESWTARGGNVAFSTRGTSGEPLVVWLDAAESETFIVPTMRGYWWAGFRPGQTALMQSPAWHRLAAMEGHAVLRLGGNAAYYWGSGGPQYAGYFMDALERVRPQFVTTTAPFLVSLLRRFEDDVIDARAMFDSVRSIVAVGLPLTGQLRAHLSDRLGSEVFERSGTQEGAAADECAMHTAPHIHADVCHLEVLAPDGSPAPAGARGRLVVTKLHDTGDPVIRYDTGDIAERFDEPCGCGRTLPRLKIYGRPESSVNIAERRITAYDVRTCVDADPELVGRQVLLVRDGNDGDVLNVAIEGTEHNAAAIERRIHDQLGVERVSFTWLGRARMAWGFRQVVDKSEVQER
ncbi:MAG: phenylacetate--CoA ligase family protein [Actinobacteria bacterium]|nr:phenylacetate--CoA ligase family protein [Actinomycetota bacterium]